MQGSGGGTIPVVFKESVHVVLRDMAKGGNAGSRCTVGLDDL